MTEFMNTLDAKLFVAKTRAKEFFKDLYYGENGVSAVIATVILVAIALVLAIAFWDRIAKVYNNLAGQIDANSKIEDSKLNK